ncbi:MAG TPA: TRAP transporter large permease subunit [Candidatus Angelobacter sp.]|nr:TRAP transporter large permease subunit [Candidatus Angelobacter sp.]
MISFLSDNMAPIMFAALVIFLLLGYPVAFSLAFVGLAFGVLGIELGLLGANLFGALPQRMWGIVSNDTLLAIPFFTYMGLILERSGMAEDLLDTVGQLFGPVRGGLAYAVVFVGALLAATTGVVAASVIAMGLISLPIMLRYGYDRSLASGVIAASGTLAQIIPPSLVLIIMADQLGRSVGDMYKGALIPGLVLAALYAGYVLLMTIVRPKSAPALPVESRTLGPGIISLLVTAVVCGAIGYGIYFVLADQVQGSEMAGFFGGVLVAYAAALANHYLKLGLLSRLAQQFIIVLIPPLALIFLVLGTIFVGLATPTEGGAMGACGAMLLAMAKRRLSFTMVRQALDSTAKLSAFVLFILIGARVFSLTFYGVNGHVWVENLLISLPGGQIGFLLVVNALVFVLAFFLDFFELAFIVVPLLKPAAETLGIDIIWFGVLLGINMQTSFMHPPFGFALFYLRSVAPRERYRDKSSGRIIDGVTTGQIYWGAIPFVGIQLVMVVLAIVFPQMIMHYKGAENANPQTIEFTQPPSDQGNGDLSQPPDLGQPPDLSQPPQINPQ